jgi:hypothetical protein
MPHNMKRCLYNLNAMNANKKEWLEAKEVQLNAEEVIEFEESSQAAATSEVVDLETNKYNRNVLLVLDCVINGMPGLFSESEVKIHNAYKALDSLA